MLTYAYNSQIHRSTDTSPFSLVLTRHPPSSAVKKKQTTLADDSTRNPNSAKNVRIRLLRQLFTMVAKTDKKLNKSQDAYKRYFERNVRFVLSFDPGHTVFVEKPPRYTKTEGERIADLPPSKLLPKTDGPYTVIS